MAPLHSSQTPQAALEPLLGLAPGGNDPKTCPLPTPSTDTQPELGQATPSRDSLTSRVQAQRCKGTVLKEIKEHSCWGSEVGAPATHGNSHPVRLIGSSQDQRITTVISHLQQKSLSA